MSNEMYRRGQSDALEKFATDAGMLKEALSPELVARAADKIGITPEMLRSLAAQRAVRSNGMRGKTPDRYRDLLYKAEAHLAKSPEGRAVRLHYRRNLDARQARGANHRLIQSLKLPAAGLALAGTGYGAYRMLRDDPDESSKAAMEKFAAGYNPDQFVPHFKANYAKHLGYGALGGGLANAGIAALRGDDLGDVAASGLRGAALGGLVGTGVGMYRGRNDPARAANHMHYIRHHAEQYSPKTIRDFGQAYYNQHAKDPATLSAMPAPVREEFERWGRAFQAAKDKAQAAESKVASDAHRLVTALSGLYPSAGAVAAGMTAPEGETMNYYARTGLGGHAGRLLGSGIGEGAGDVIAALLHKDPALLREVGKQLGGIAGGATGGHVGHNWAQQASYS